MDMERLLGVIARKFQRNVKRLRLARDLSQHDLAARTGLSVSMISMMESGRRLPSFEAMVAVAAGLRTRPRELLS